MEKLNIRRQINKLLVLDGAGALMIAGASWVALLAARGFSSIQIGLAESIFHVTSMLFEIPSGAVADVFGRKTTLALSRVLAVISAIIMIISNSFMVIAVAMIFSALSYNMASGTREALAYDSLKQGGSSEDYEKFSATDLIVYEICVSFATLLAGFVLWLGYKRAYAIDVVIGMGTIGLALSLHEVAAEGHENMSIKDRFRDVFVGSFVFLKDNGKARALIIFSALVDSIAVLILFFMQAKLTQVGLNAALLGPALFVMGIGSAIGAKLITMVDINSIKIVMIIALLGAVFNLATVFSGNPYIMILGGFICSFTDSWLSVKSDVYLNDMIPSSQRATLVSVNSFAYSVVMIVMSPIMGIMFS